MTAQKIALSCYRIVGGVAEDRPLPKGEGLQGVRPDRNFMNAMTLKKIPAAAALSMTLLSAWLPVVAGQINARRPPRQRRRLTESIDNRRTVLLPGTTHARIRQARDQGRVRADLVMERAILALKSGPEQEADLRGFLAQQQDPSSPHYHEWLTPRQF